MTWQIYKIFLKHLQLILIVASLEAYDHLIRLLSKVRPLLIVIYDQNIVFERIFKAINIVQVLLICSFPTDRKLSS